MSKARQFFIDLDWAIMPLVGLEDRLMVTEDALHGVVNVQDTSKAAHCGLELKLKESKQTAIVAIMIHADVVVA